MKHCLIFRLLRTNDGTAPAVEFLNLVVPSQIRQNLQITWVKMRAFSVCSARPVKVAHGVSASSHMPGNIQQQVEEASRDL